MAPPVGVKLSQLERTARMLKRMQFAFSKQFPRCEVKLVTGKWGQGQAFLEIENVVSFLILPCGTSKIFALDDAGISTFLFDNYPQDGDLDRRMKSHDRMWRLFMASPIGQEKIKAWNALPVQTRVRMPPQQMAEKMETGLPLLNEKLQGGIPAGRMTMFASPPRKSRSYNCLVISEHDRVASRAVAQMIGARFENRENVVLFRLDHLARHSDLEIEGMLQLAREKGLYSFNKVSTMEELVEAVEKVRANEGFGQRLHLIIDAPSLVVYAESNRELDNCMFALSFRFNTPALKQIAENVEVLTVVVKAPE